jgi:hypothetical protein
MGFHVKRTRRSRLRPGTVPVTARACRIWERFRALERCPRPAAAAAPAGESPTPAAALLAGPATGSVPDRAPEVPWASAPVAAYEPAPVAASGEGPAEEEAPVEEEAGERLTALAEAVAETRPRAAAGRRTGRHHRPERGNPIPPPSPGAPQTNPRTRFHVKRRRHWARSHQAGSAESRRTYRSHAPCHPCPLRMDRQTRAASLRPLSERGHWCPTHEHHWYPRAVLKKEKADPHQ